MTLYKVSFDFEKSLDIEDNRYRLFMFFHQIKEENVRAPCGNLLHRLAFYQKDLFLFR